MSKVNIDERSNPRAGVAGYKPVTGDKAEGAGRVRPRFPVIDVEPQRPQAHAAPDHGASCAGPAEFVRLRYFFGQRLGVIDFADEQAYLVGKQRFHNERAHGAGVLCGLRAERFAFPQGAQSAKSPTTLLRVRRGAAIDACGREIVVGSDQCIDVAAWYLKNRPARRGHLLWVALRYRECPSDPAPAPRDPCGCDAGGCEHSRVREGFELVLLTQDEAQACATREREIHAVTDLQAEEVHSGAVEEAVERALARFIGKDCPEPPADPCLLLASFRIYLDDAEKSVVDIGVPDNTPPERLSLVPTALLQDALSAVVAAAAEAGQIGAGPRLAGVRFTSTGKDTGTLSVQVSGGALVTEPFDKTSPQLTAFVSYFTGTGWKPIKVEPKYESAPHPRVQLDLSGLAAGRYRVLLESDRAEPPVDAKMRPLVPPSWARHFELVQEGGAAGHLVLSDPTDHL